MQDTTREQPSNFLVITLEGKCLNLKLSRKSYGGAVLKIGPDIDKVMLGKTVSPLGD
jgi:hypothetical protein